MKESTNSIVSIVALLGQFVIAYLLWDYDFIDEFWIGGIILMLILILANWKIKMPVTLGFALAVSWMVVAIYFWPEIGQALKKPDMEDVLRSSSAAVEFLTCGWVYIFNRQRW